MIYQAESGQSSRVTTDRADSDVVGILRKGLNGEYSQLLILPRRAIAG